jgi:hypothetical protein
MPSVGASSHSRWPALPDTGCGLWVWAPPPSLLLASPTMVSMDCWLQSWQLYLDHVPWRSLCVMWMDALGTDGVIMDLRVTSTWAVMRKERRNACLIRNWCWAQGDGLFRGQSTHSAKWILRGKWFNIPSDKNGQWELECSVVESIGDWCQTPGLHVCCFDNCLSQKMPL